MTPIRIEKTDIKRAVPGLLIMLLVWLPLDATASVFGDGDPANGVEDQRVQRHDVDVWPVLFNAVGKIVCEGMTEGSAVLLDINDQPVVLTAGHVLQSFDLSSCEFHSGVNRWNRGKLVQSVGVGNLGDTGNTTLPMKYEQDWSMVRTEPWTNWRHWALSEDQVVGSHHASGLAFLVGFDVVSGRLKAHIRCNVGSAEQTALLEGTSRLVWDDCHSMGGASGGALFVQTAEGMRLLGIRIGSLFVTEGDNRQPPPMGDRFDLQRHINVSLRVADILNQ